MIKFFRNIRKDVLSRGKIRTYILYGLGEIVLVVIGILLALQINNWNEDVKNKKIETQYLIQLKEEIIYDSLSLEKSWFKHYSRKEEYLLNAKEYIMERYTIQDTVAFINNTGYGGIHSRANFLGESATFKELLNTGNLGKIKDKLLIQEILVFYGQKQSLRTYASNIRSNFADYMNALKPFNPEHPNDVNPQEIGRILRKIKSDEFHGLVNQELSFTYAMQKALIRFKSRCGVLSSRINSYLNRS